MFDVMGEGEKFAWLPTSGTSHDQRAQQDIEKKVFSKKITNVIDSK